MSLASQLATIKNASAGVALDRKKRFKLHSASLIYDPKEAQTQDYEFIFNIGIEGLDELSNLNPKFDKFKLSLFSDSAINIDRNVQTKEQIEDLDRAVEVFLSLLAPYLHLSPSVKALEWVLRRFQVHVHSPESLLLASLPYYNSPIFVKILNTISELPPLFSWLTGYKKQLKNPTNMSIVKGFADVDFFKLYSEYLIKQLKQSSEYQAQLVFYLSNTIQLTASFNNNLDKLNKDILPAILEVCGHLLLAASVECKLTAYSVISVLCSVTPLNDELILSIADSVLTGFEGFSSNLKKSTIIVLGKLFQFFEGELTLDISEKFSTKLNPAFFVDDKSIIVELKEDNNKINSFLYHYANGLLVSEIYESVSSVLALTKLSTKQFKTILVKLATVVDQLTDKLVIAPVFELLWTTNQQLFKQTLLESNVDIYDLEMKLMLSLVSNDDKEVEDDEDEEQDEEETTQKPEQGDLVEIFNNSKTTVKSFLSTDSSVSEEFNKLLSIFIQAANGKSTLLFFKNTFGTVESAVSFILRTLVSSLVPVKAKLLASKSLKTILKGLSKTNELYLLTPLLVVALIDTHKSVQSRIIDIISSINKSTEDSKDSKPLFMKAEIYGSKQNPAIISPKDASSLLKDLCASIDEVLLDQETIYKILGAIFSTKKTGILSLLFFSGQYELLHLSSIQLRYLKVFNNLDVKFTLPKSELFKSVLESYTIGSDYSFGETVDQEALEKETLGLISGEDKNSEYEYQFLLKNLNKSDLVRQRIPEVFDNFSANYRKKISIALLDNDAFDIIENIHLTPELIVTLFDRVKINESMPSTSVTTKRRRRSSNSQNIQTTEVKKLAADHVQKISSLLDICQAKSDALSSPLLLPKFCSILNELEYIQDTNVSIVYPQEGVSNALLKLIYNLKASVIDHIYDSNSIRADVIVNTIRSSDSPQVQNKLLLVIAELAELAPELILHSIMPIFTFMGAHTLRQDDAFSAQVVSRTISKVIPALTKNAASSVKDESELILYIFCSAFSFIPRHRRNSMFVQLARSLGSEYSCGIILNVIGQKYNESLAKYKTIECLAYTEFSSAFLKNFNVEEQLSAIVSFLELWSIIPFESSDSESEEALKLSARPIFGPSIATATKDELSNLKYGLVKFINETILNGSDELPHLRLRIAKVLLDDRSSESQIQSVLYKLGQSLGLLLSIVDELETKESLENLNGAIYEMLGNMLELLPIKYFVDSISELVVSKKSVKIAKHMATLASRKFEREPSTDEVALASVERLLPLLISNVSEGKDIELTQSSLETFSILVSKFGNGLDSSSLLRYLGVIVSVSGLTNANIEVALGAIGGIAAIVSSIGVKMIGVYPRIVPPTLKIWEKVSDVVTDSTVLTQTAVLVLFSNLIKKIPAFMINDLNNILNIVLKSEDVDETVKSTVLDIMVQQMDLKAVMKALCNYWKEVSTLEISSIGLYLNALQATIDAMDRKSTASEATVFVKFLLNALEFRSHSELDNNSIHRVEASLYSCANVYIMKLNDKSFRPLFASMVRWAFEAEGVVSDISEVERLSAFFRFFNKLQENLKSIVTNYFTYLIESTGAILERFISNNLVDINLRRIILISLTSSLRYDQDDYWKTQARFELIAPCLINQLVNVEDSIGKYVVKAIGSLAKNCNSEDQKKIINDLLLSHMKLSCGSREKFWAVRSLKIIYQKVENWANLLPELVPILAELLEDDDEKVEFEVRSGLVKVIEEAIGEPLDRYLD